MNFLYYILAKQNNGKEELRELTSNIVPFKIALKQIKEQYQTEETGKQEGSRRPCKCVQY